MAFIPQYEPLIKYEYAGAVHSQIMSGWIGPGEKVLEFENKICEITGAKHCISTTSGTTALYIAIMATCVKNEKLYFPDYTFLAGANAAKIANREIRLIDIKEDTLCMNPVILEQDLDHLDYPGSRPNIAGVIFVNHNGYVGIGRYETKRLCDDYGIIMIEDSSQALGMCDGMGVHAGRVGDIGIFSFSVPKLITTGQGGCIITDSSFFADECNKIRDQGGDWKKTKIHHDIGGNFKFNDILASYGLSQLDRIDELLGIRKQVFDWYRENIEIVDFGYDSTWMVLYRTKKAKELIEKLKENEIQATQYYNPIHTNPPYKINDSFTYSEIIAEEIVYLPSSLTLKKEDVDKICKIILEVKD